jgi:hypothetical protein
MLFLRNIDLVELAKPKSKLEPIIMTTTRPFEMLHMDLFGSVAYISIGSNKYGLIIIDDYSRFTWVFFL